MSVSTTTLARAAVEKFMPAGTVLRLDEPQPEHLSIEGTFVPLYAQVYVLDGWRDRFEQQPEIEVAFFSRRFLTTEAAALAVEAGLVRYPVRVQVGGRAAVLDRVAVTTATREVPWDVDAGVTRFIGSYQLRTRS